jgi:hypothetical protein
VRLCATIAVCDHPAAMTLRSATSVALLVSILGLASCSALVDPDTRKLGQQPMACSPGEVASCPCDDGHWSSQRCNAGGSFDPCACGMASTTSTSGSGSTSGPGNGHGRGNNAPIGQAGAPAN